MARMDGGTVSLKLAATAVQFRASGLLFPLRASVPGGLGQSTTSVPPSEGACEQALFRVATLLRGEQGRMWCGGSAKEYLTFPGVIMQDILLSFEPLGLTHRVAYRPLGSHNSTRGRALA